MFLGAIYMLAMVMSLKCFVCFFEKLYFCVVCVDDLWCLYFVNVVSDLM